MVGWEGSAPQGAACPARTARPADGQRDQKLRTNAASECRSGHFSWFALLTVTGGNEELCSLPLFGHNSRRYSVTARISRSGANQRQGASCAFQSLVVATQACSRGRLT